MNMTRLDILFDAIQQQYKGDNPQAGFLDAIEVYTDYASKLDQLTAKLMGELEASEYLLGAVVNSEGICNDELLDKIEKQLLTTG